MQKCQFFKTESKFIYDNSIQAHRQQVAPTEIKLPWCSHPQSDVTKSDATQTIGGGGLLRCGGDLAKCQLPKGYP